ncbi:MAG TPA: inositol monophosphatase family protein, partial [Aggregatilineales bacterium]|nr:inositol monophosphatase family protein [Aggregatilineales bacterium]
WDVMAGLLFVTEAGGRVSNYTGGTERLYEGRELIASNGILHDAMMSVLALREHAANPAISVLDNQLPNPDGS